MRQNDVCSEDSGNDSVVASRGSDEDLRFPSTWTHRDVQGKFCLSPCLVQAKAGRWPPSAAGCVRQAYRAPHGAGSWAERVVVDIRADSQLHSCLYEVARGA